MITMMTMTRDRRRPTGLEEHTRETIQDKRSRTLSEKVGKEATAPVEVQGIWRDWMGKARSAKPDLQNYAQTALPLNLIPIRIDLDIPAFTLHHLFQCHRAQDTLRLTALCQFTDHKR